MKASIIIPSLNSPIIRRVLQHLKQQTAWEQVGEILVVGKDDRSLADEKSPIRFLDTVQPVNASSARNLGIQAAKYDLLVFLDSDCLPQPSWLAEHLHAQETGHAVVGGGVLASGSNYWGLSYNLSLFHEFLANDKVGPRDYLPTLNLSVHKGVIEVVGGLNENLARGQDIEWTVRMRCKGYQPFFWPPAAIQHAHTRTTFSQVWRDCARSGYYMRQIRLKNLETMQAPFWLRYRWMILVFSPLIAAGVTGRILMKRPFLFKKYWQTFPAIYLTKIAWCWGASQKAL